MATMERHIATIDADEHLTLPAAVKSALGIHAGTQLEVSVVDRHLLLKPLEDEDPIEAVRGMFGAGSSLEDDLNELRALEK